MILAKGGWRGTEAQPLRASQDMQQLGKLKSKEGKRFM